MNIIDDILPKILVLLIPVGVFAYLMWRSGRKQAQKEPEVKK